MELAERTYASARTLRGGGAGKSSAEKVGHTACSLGRILRFVIVYAAHYGVAYPAQTAPMLLPVAFRRSLLKPSPVAEDFSLS